MHPISRAHVNRLEKYLTELEKSNPKLHYELDLSKLTGLMNNVGFNGPDWKRGSVVGFSHELLVAMPFLTDGQFSAHIAHGGKVHKIRYRDFKKYILPNIEAVLTLLAKENLIQENE